jgi:hypothetical protein
VSERVNGHAQTSELRSAGFAIDETYQPSVSIKQLRSEHINETYNEGMLRQRTFIRQLANTTVVGTTILLVAHASTIDSRRRRVGGARVHSAVGARALLHGERAADTIAPGDNSLMDVRYPYCANVSVMRIDDTWTLEAGPLPALTCQQFSSQINTDYFHRKGRRTCICTHNALHRHSLRPMMHI